MSHRVRKVAQHLASASTSSASAQTQEADQPVNGSIAARTLVASAQSLGQTVDVTFEDGAAYRFHALWLRDACRDDAFVAQAAGERILSETPLVAGFPDDLAATAAAVSDGGTRLHVEWSDERGGAFDAALLRAYAPVVAMPLASPPASAASPPLVDTQWLAPFTGLPTAPAPTPAQLRLWFGGTGAKNESETAFRTFGAAEVFTDAGNLALLQTLARDGVAKVDNVTRPGPEALHTFANRCVGGLQKDPSRQQANWLIEKKQSAASISYNPDLRLLNHTDQSLPNHGTPGLLLVMHYVTGSGSNTLVDGFAAAEALRERDPDAFEILARVGNDQERDLLRSRQDAKQNHTNSLYLSSKKPIIQLDPHSGRVARIQYNEVFRMPAGVGFQDFPQWHAAYVRFARMLHDPEFERVVPMRAGQILVVNNWRVLHGRAANLQSPDRTLVGGTVTRETFFSRARELLQRTHGVELFGPELLSA